MNRLDINIDLDPVNDGAEIIETKIRKKYEGALIIATNGKSRIAGTDEAEEIISELGENGEGTRLGNTFYIAIYNWHKVLDMGQGRCLIGSVIIMKRRDNKLYPLEGDDFEDAAQEFQSRLVTVVGDGQEFSALEL